MSNRTFIYALAEPDSREVRYIGKSDKPSLRLRQHLCDNKPSHKRNWIQSLLSVGKSPCLLLIDNIPAESWEFYEKAYLKVFREMGFDLVNTVEGGVGVGSGTKHPWFGKRHTAEAREKIASATGERCRGKPLTPEHREAISAGMRGKKRGPYKKASAKWSEWNKWRKVRSSK